LTAETAAVTLQLDSIDLNESTLAVATRRRPEASHPPRSLKRLTALDGLRAVLVATVIAQHLFDHGWKADPGTVGVTGFFALSGFLITSNLLSEDARTGRIDLRGFYRRRALRLLPALALFLAVWALVALVFGHDQWLTTVPSARSPGNPIPYPTVLEAVGAGALYVTNWLEAFPHAHLWYSYSPIGQLWTLAVEDQFYLLWAPLTMVLVRHRRWGLPFVATISVGLLLEPLLFLHANFNRLYFGTDTRGAALCLGALTAWLWHRGTFDRWRRSRAAPWIGTAIIGTLVWAVPELDLGRVEWVIGLGVASVASALAVVYLTIRPHAWAARILSQPVLVAIGRRSYAIYLWSYVLNTWFRDTGVLKAPLVLLTTALAAEVSWRFVESRALGLKDNVVKQHRLRGLTPPSRDHDGWLPPPSSGPDIRAHRRDGRPRQRLSV
jgi:peptidoglycan/LPS O-acetylase OafA/YrhL